MALLKNIKNIMCQTHEENEIKFFCMEENCKVDVGRLCCEDCFDPEFGNHLFEIKYSNKVQEKDKVGIPHKFLITQGIKYRMEQLKQSGQSSLIAFMDYEHQKYSSVLEKVEQIYFKAGLAYEKTKKQVIKMMKEIEELLKNSQQNVKQSLLEQIKDIEWSMKYYKSQVNLEEDFDFIKKDKPIEMIASKQQQQQLFQLLKDPHFYIKQFKEETGETKQNGIQNNFKNLEAQQLRFQKEIDLSINLFQNLKKSLSSFSMNDIDIYQGETICNKLWQVQQKEKSYLVSVGHDNFLRKWDIDQKIIAETQEIKFEKENMKISCSLQFDLFTLILGCQDGSIKMVNFIDFKQSVNLQGHSCQISNLVKVSPKMFISTDLKGEMRFWDYGTRNCLHVVEAHSKPILQSSISIINEETIVTVSQDKLIKLWNLTSKKCVKDIKTDYRINACTYLKEQDKKEQGLLAIAVEQGIQLWNILKKLIIYTQKDAHKDQIIDIQQISSKVFLTVSIDKEIKIWDIMSEKVQMLNTIPLNNGQIYIVNSYVATDTLSSEKERIKMINLWK